MILLSVQTMLIRRIARAQGGPGQHAELIAPASNPPIAPAQSGNVELARAF